MWVLVCVYAHSTSSTAQHLQAHLKSVFFLNRIVSLCSFRLHDKNRTIYTNDCTTHDRLANGGVYLDLIQTHPIVAQSSIYAALSFHQKQKTAKIATVITTTGRLETVGGVELETGARAGRRPATDALERIQFDVDI